MGIAGLVSRAQRRVARGIARRQFGHDWIPPDPLAFPSCPPGHRTGPPDFVGVGTQKSGTSWWFSLLTHHPRVHHDPSLPKERHVFATSWDDSDETSWVSRYAAWFPRPPDHITGEWTPRIMFDPWIPPLLARAAPEARLLVLLRDPLDRFLSAIKHYESRGARMTQEIVNDAMQRGLYGHQLRHLLRSFPKEQILVQQYERCVAHPQQEWSRVLAHLGLDPVPTPQTSLRVNAGSARPRVIPAHLRATLMALYRDDAASVVEDWPGLDRERWPTLA